MIYVVSARYGNEMMYSVSARYVKSEICHPATSSLMLSKGNTFASKLPKSSLFESALTHITGAYSSAG